MVLKISVQWVVSVLVTGFLLWYFLQFFWNKTKKSNATRGESKPDDQPKQQSDGKKS